MVFSGFVGLVDRPHPRWKGPIIYTSCVCWIRLRSPALFKHLTTYHWKVRAKHPCLNLLSVSYPYLIVYVQLLVRLICSRAVTAKFKMRIRLIDRDARDWTYLFLLTTRTAQSLNWTGAPAWRKRPRVARLFDARWTRGVISWRSETYHYNH